MIIGWSRYSKRKIVKIGAATTGLWLGAFLLDGTVAIKENENWSIPGQGRNLSPGLFLGGFGGVGQ